jgi:hypothetical protein
MLTKPHFLCYWVLYPDYTNMVHDSKKRKKRKVTTKQSKAPKIRSGATPSQASKEILLVR